MLCYRLDSSLIYLLLIVTSGCTAENKKDKLLSDTVKIQTRPNVILITISSLRADHVSCMGYDRQTTPNFDKFAGDNILFTNAFATSSWQMPAVGSIFTSMYPSDHEAIHVIKKLGANVNTIAGILNKNGYHTAGFGCNPRLMGDWGFGKGFEIYDDYSVLMSLSSMSLDEDGSIDINKRRTNDLVNDAVFRWLESNVHSPFFLSVHYYDTHWDYLPEEPYDKLFAGDYDGDIDGTEIAKEPLYSNRPCDRDVEHMIALYDGEVRQTDDDLGELLRVLEANGRLEDSIIIIMGDHGEQFYEHGNTSHHGVFDELIHVPLAMSIPGANSPRKVTSLVSGVDIMPTVLSYTGIEIPQQCKGVSLKALVNDESDNVRDFVFAEYAGGAVEECSAVRFENYKFVQQGGDLFAYDLVADPSEMKKIYRGEFTVEMDKLLEKVEHLLLKAEVKN